MLTMGYKILAKVLDNRLKTVLQFLISEHQTGFMEGRNILNNVVNLLLITEYAQTKRLISIIMAIDFEKCFDLIDHIAIRGALRYFGIGENYIKWTMLLFSEFEVCTQNNGNSSAWFKPTKDVTFHLISLFALDRFLLTFLKIIKRSMAFLRKKKLPCYHSLQMILIYT